MKKTIAAFSIFSLGLFSSCETTTNSDTFNFIKKVRHFGSNKDINKHGLLYEYYPNGVKRSEMNWHYGVPHGREATWYPDGMQNTIRYWKKGKMDGMQATWDARGALVSKKRYNDGELVEDLLK